MKRLFFIAFLLLGILNIKAQQFSSISDSAVISLITCSPGEEVYSKFGHTAIRINDSKYGVDIVFNYGIFSFETEDFYYKFIKGETDYQLGIYDTRNFLPEYAERNSMVSEQILNLTLVEKRKIINLLLKNYEPQNRIYRYNFVFDNCSTRPRDKIISSLNGYVKFQSASNAKTFRQWIGEYVGTDTWLKFGIDIVFGIDADKPANNSESMFLPENLMNEFQTAQVVSPDGHTRKLVARENTLVNKTEIKEQIPSVFSRPLSISVILFVLGMALTIWDYKKKKLHFRIFDTLILVITGIGGLITFYLMFFSVHPLVKSNFNLLWLNPLNIAVAVFIWIKRLRVTLFYYQMVNILLLVGALVAFALSEQAFNLATFPLIVLLLMRTTCWFDLTKKRIFLNNKLFRKRIIQ